MRVDGVETSAEDRLDNVYGQLEGATTEREAWVALSEADTSTLRELEALLFKLPGPVDDLRERLVVAHVHFKEHWRAQMLSTAKVTPKLFQQWAVAVLVEWLAGYTDFREEWGGQYRIRVVIDESDNSAVFEVATAQGYDPRRFRVAVSVAEES